MQIYIINLADAEIRRKNMLENIGDMIIRAKQRYKNNRTILDFMESVRFEIFTAVDAKKNGHSSYRKHFSPLRCVLRRAMNARDEELACYASHFNLWQKCIDINQGIVVIEDDVNFNDNFFEGLYNIVSSELSYVRLHYIDEANFHHIGHNFYSTTRDIAGGAGYFITPSAAVAFSRIKYWDLPVDLMMDSVYKHGIANVVYMEDNKCIIYTEKVPSQIPNRRPKKRLIYKLLRELYRPIIAVRYAIFLLSYTPPSVKKG